jgi:hypothetical protein
MLRAGKGERRRIYERKKKVLKDLDYRGKKRDKTVRGAKVRRLSRFGNGYDVGRLPDSGEVSRVDRKVEELSEKRDTMWARDVSDGVLLGHQDP